MNREWIAKWIGPQEEDKFNPVFYKDFFVDEQVKKATLYIASIGVFEAYINGNRVGNEYLTPYEQDLEKGIQYFEFDITEELNYGENSEANSLDVFLGTGWVGDEANRFALRAEIVIEVEDTDDETEYLSMEFDEILVKPEKPFDKSEKIEIMDDFLDFDKLFADESEINDILGEPSEKNVPDDITVMTKEAEDFFEEAEELENDEFDGLFSDDMLDELIYEIIDDEKTDAKTETEEKIEEPEEIFKEPEEFAEETIEEYAIEPKNTGVNEEIAKLFTEEIPEDEASEPEPEEVEAETEIEEDAVDAETEEEEVAVETEEEEVAVETEEEEVAVETEVEEDTVETEEEEAEPEIEEAKTETGLEAEADEPESVPEVLATVAIAGAIVGGTETQEISKNVIIIGTDETWGYYASDIESCGIGKGEVFNRLLWADKENPDKEVAVLELDIPLVERYEDPITILEEIKAENVVRNAAGEELLDFGRPFTGYVSFSSNLPIGTKLVLDFVNDPEEVSDQPGFSYISDGIPEIVNAHFSYFRGRFVKVSGWNEPLDPEDFTAVILLPEEPDEIEEIYEEEADTLQTGFFETSDNKLNRLFDNIYTRQEKTIACILSEEDGLQENAPEQIDKFTAAACYNMDVKDQLEALLADQMGKCQVTVPWILYNMYGDRDCLEKHYEIMKKYVEETAGELDGYLKESEEFIPYDAASDKAFIASANYYESADIVGKAAKVLGNAEDAEKYSQLAASLKQAVLDEFFTPSGRTFLSTQEEMVTALRTGMYNNKERFAKALKDDFAENEYRISCGAEEAPLLCKILAENGLEDLAYQVLLKADNHGWLYSVEESDFAIWTSEDAIVEDGTVDYEILEADDSLEYGAVAEFLYANVLGIKPLEPGFHKIRLAPMPNSSLIFANGEYRSPAGKIVSGWEISEEGEFRFHFEIPEGAEANVVLPFCEDESLAVQELASGAYDFEYMPKF